MDNDIYDYAIQVMRKKRIAMGWSQQELSYHTTNISRSFIRDVENPKRRERLNLGHINQLESIYRRRRTNKPTLTSYHWNIYKTA
jgi:ribosome-binding protein aMBF1 (putative translation factor)